MDDPLLVRRRQDLRDVGPHRSTAAAGAQGSASCSPAAGVSTCTASAAFENLVGCHLLKWVHFREDTLGAELELRYFRDTDGREVDFVVVERREPRLLVECKWGDAEVDRNLRYLKAKFPDAEAWQISATGTRDYLTPECIRAAPALALLRQFV